MSNHTKGTWEVQSIETNHSGYDDWPVFAVRSPRNHCLAIIGRVDRATSGDNEANAYLIAAAPDLLRACELTCMTCFRKKPETCEDCAVRQAISKAEPV